MTHFKKVAVTVEVDPLVVLVLDAIAAHLGKDRAETVAEALQAFFAVLPRQEKDAAGGNGSG